MSEWHNGDLLVGNCLDRIKDIPSESIDCCISSPPYWGLRDYQVDGQWGSEETFEEYLDNMMELMGEIKRILKPSGSCWINLGDSYSTQSGGMRDLAEGKTAQYGSIKYTDKSGAYNVKQPKIHLKPKTRVGIPERFMIKCIDDGWLLRNHIPWVKSNAMPTSVKDRFQNKWESVFFFVKQGKYFFDLDAVREKPISDSKVTKKNIVTKKTQSGLFEDVVEKSQLNRKELDVPGQLTQGIHRNRAVGKDDWDYTKTYKTSENTPASNNSLKVRMAASRGAGNSHDGALNDPKGKNPGDVFYDKSKPYAVVERNGVIYFRNLPSHDEIRKFLNNARKVSKITVDKLEEIFENYTPHHWFEKNGSFPTREDWIKVKGILNFDDTFDDQMTTLYPKDAEKINDPKGKNPGDVFFINPKPFVAAHFATFPEELPHKIIRCAVPEKVCKYCGVPVESIMEPTEEYAKSLGQSWHDHSEDLTQGMKQKMKKDAVTASYRKVGETTCHCGVGFEPGVVFDPFMGAGTVALVALKLNRRWLGIELNPEYVEIIRNRLKPQSNESLDGFSS